MHRPARRSRRLLRASPPHRAASTGPEPTSTAHRGRRRGAIVLRRRRPRAPPTPPPSGLAAQDRPIPASAEARARADHRSISCSLAAGHCGVVGGHLTRRHGRVDAVGDQRSCKESGMARQRPSTQPPGHRWAAANHHRDDPLAPSQGKVVPDASNRELLAHRRPALPAIQGQGGIWGHGPARAQDRPLGTLIAGNQPHRGARLLKISQTTACTPWPTAEDRFSAHSDNSLCAVRGDRVR